MLSRMEEYLYTIKNELGYNTAFVVSENSRKYYTYEGLNKIVLPELDEHDIWYSIFLDGGKKYDFDVDTDEVIREIPPEKSLDMLQKMWEMAGILVDERR